MEISYQPEDMRPEASFSDGHVPRESVESDHQAKIELHRISLAYDLDDPVHSELSRYGEGQGARLTSDADGNTGSIHKVVVRDNIGQIGSS